MNAYKRWALLLLTLVLLGTAIVGADSGGSAWLHRTLGAIVDAQHYSLGQVVAMLEYRMADGEARSIRDVNDAARATMCDMEVIHCASEDDVSYHQVDLLSQDMARLALGRADFAIRMHPPETGA